MSGMTEAKSYVRTDAHGVLRVGQTRVSLDSVVYAFRNGDSAESIREQYPALSLEEVYGAIAYYLANRDEVHHYLERQDKVWEEQRRHAEQAPNPLLERLRAQKAKTAPEQ